MSFASLKNHAIASINKVSASKLSFKIRSLETRLISTKLILKTYSLMGLILVWEKIRVLFLYFNHKQATTKDG